MSNLANESSDGRERARRSSEAVRRPPVIMPPQLRASGVPPVLKGFLRRPELYIQPGSLLSPAELEQFGNLLPFARSTVEGYFVGKHKSPHRGSSVEFTDYKEYVLSLIHISVFIW